MIYKLARSAEDIEDVIRQCNETDVTAFRGLIYEDGVRAALDWLLGNTDESPFSNGPDDEPGPGTRALCDIDS